MRRLLSILLLILLPGVAAARFEPEPCWFAIPPGEDARCGMLVVPERRSAPDGPQVRLAVAVLSARTDTPEPDPVVFLNGGPGDEAFFADPGHPDPMADWWAFSAPFRADRDFVVFDQRGVGRSRPRLDCPELDVATVQRIFTARRRTADCFARLQAEGVDLGAYSTVTSADDVADLILALGTRKANLLGVSYGSRLGLEVMRRHPALIRAAVFDSVYPPDIVPDAREADLAAAAFRRLFADCAAERACARAFPNLAQDFDAVLADLRATPVAREVGGGSYTLIDDVAVLGALLGALYDPDEIPYLPGLIAGAARGDREALIDRAEPLVLGEPDISEGLLNTLECRENHMLADPDAVDARAEALAPFGRVVRDNPNRLTCPAWPVGPPLPADPVASDIPTLLITGRYDPVTPPHWAAHAARSLTASRILEFANAGHSVTSTHDCAVLAAVAFLEQPRDPTLPECLKNNPGPSFHVTGAP